MNDDCPLTSTDQKSKKIPYTPYRKMQKEREKHIHNERTNTQQNANHTQRERWRETDEGFAGGRQGY